MVYVVSGLTKEDSSEYFKMIQVVYVAQSKEEASGMFTEEYITKDVHLLGKPMVISQDEIDAFTRKTEEDKGES